MEQTVVIVKPDGVKRGLIGEIIKRFEQTGLKVVALKMIVPSEVLLQKHYKSTDEEYLKSLGKKTLATYEQYKIDPIKELGTDDPLRIGKMVMDWLLKYVASGPVVPMILEGRHAVDNARMISGATMPVNALPGTIRGDFSTDSAAYANVEKRSVMNLVHASGTVEEANFEKALWFAPEEIHEYKRVEEYLT
ncbi:nucleoside-diphosphate kinase [Patescibacteria group bacterium]|nr:nucleoside-diphosphate kinase [Patescibacteria group bacterium]